MHTSCVLAAALLGLAPAGAYFHAAPLSAPSVVRGSIGSTRCVSPTSWTPQCVASGAPVPRLPARHAMSMRESHRKPQESRIRGLERPTRALLASALVAGLAVAALNPSAALAAAEAGEHLHVGQKIANFFRRGGLPDWLTLMAISAMPVVELRGGVPVGVWMGLPPAQTLALCVLGNMVPIPVILLALRSKFVQDLAKPVLDRAREKSEGFGDEGSQALALTLFVGIPLPGTGAWTGAMGAFLLGMPFRKAMASIFLGVVSAGLIMTTLTLAGRAGALVATGVLAVFCVSSIVSSGKKK